MKNKPTRHKELNTFKFQPFSERITNLDIDVFHRIGHKNEEYSEEDTFFHQTLQKWNLLNLSECYEEFRRELPCVQTLPLLLNQSDVVIDVILKHLSKNNPLSLQAVLDLLAALMKDLRHEIYPSYGIILQKLCELLSTKDADELEWILTCLAYMFKYLWRYIVKDLNTVLDSLIPLLSSNKPHYINNFAAESFAYVARKVKNKRDFVKLILKTLESRHDSVKGCGRLMFEVLKGLKHRFHSSADEFLLLTFEMLHDTSLNSLLLYEVLSDMCTAMCSSIDPKHIRPFWTASFSVLIKFYADSSEENLNPVLYNLQLVKQVLEYKDGLLVVEPSNTVVNILKVLDKVKNEKASLVLSSIVSSMLLSPKIQLSQEQACQITIRILKLPFESTVLDFVFKVLQYTGFETFVLPWVQNYVCKEILKNINFTQSNLSLFNCLAHIILHKSPPCLNGIELDNWKRYPLDLYITSRSKTGKKQSIVECLFDEGFLEKISMQSNIEYLINVCLVLPHINLVEKEQVIHKLKEFMTIVCSEIRDCNNMESSSLQRLLFLFLVLFEALIHMANMKIVKEICNENFIIDTILPLAKYPQYICALNAIDMYLTSMVKQKLNLSSSLVNNIYHGLSDNLLSPYHKIRLMTTHIMCYCSDAINSSSKVYFENCFQSESIEVGIQNYREKLLHLKRLSYDLLETNNNCDEELLRYFLGVLYINFQLLWEPVSELISSFARGMPTTKFWKVFVSQLQKSAEDAQSINTCVPKDTFWENDIMCDVFINYFQFDDKPDFMNYRILLWKSFENFPEICQMKNREVSPLLFNFLEKEYFVVNAEDSLCNIQQYNSSDSGIEESTNCTNAKISVEKSKYSHMYKTLVAHLRVFAKLSNPRAIYKANELREHYHNFLTFKNSNIQRIALDCIMAYKEKHFAPYSSHLYGLLKDETFKSELVVFQIGKESSIVLEEHRAEIIPVVIRILYGRMFTKIGRSGPGKKSSDVRKSLILRFLSGCEGSEMKMFLELAFKIILPHLQENPEITVKKLSESIDLCRVISLKRLRGSLDMAMTVMENFGGLMENETLSYVLHIILCLGGYISAILTKKSEIHSGFTSGLRILRNSSLVAITKFFCQFGNYPWNPQDINAVFSVFVWPLVEKLPIEGIHSPTALLKLFAAWSRDSKYFHLLIKSKDDKSDIKPLSSVMTLLVGAKVKPTVTSLIMDMIGSLLTTADYSEEITTELSDLKESPEDLNYGSKILLPYVPLIIKHLHQKLSDRKKKGLNSRDLMILSRVCELKVDSETSENLLKLLFNTFLKKVEGSDTTIIHLVSTICSLLKNVSFPFEYLRSIAPLFGTVTTIEARKMLCELLSEISNKETHKKIESLSQNVKLIQDINAWDVKWVEQPDFGRRLDGFKLAHSMIESGSLISDFGVIVVYNCFYLLKHEKDLSMRDSSGYCLRKITPYICNLSRTAKDNSIPEIILRLIASGINQKINETVHNEAILLLGELVRECPDVHPILCDLKDLASKEDPEVDFFNNIIHLQSHRRAKALVKFCAIAKKMIKRPCIRTLTQFILPLVSSFLCNDKYTHRKNVVDAGIASLGVVCNLLPWNHYETVLRHYLYKLRTVTAYQKQLVRVIVSILDAFHFDFSNFVDGAKDVQKGNVMVPSRRKSLKEPVDGDSSFISAPEKTDSENAYSKSPQVEDFSTLKQEEEEEEKGDEEKKEDKKKEEEADDDDDNDEASNHELECETDEDDVPEDIAVSKEDESLISLEPVILRPIKLSSTIAQHVIRSITVGLLPQLQRAIGECKSSDFAHKLNKKKSAAEREEEDTMCIPVALAIVKLLQKLPSKYLDQNLPGIFLNICKFLKSRLESVRRVTREILQKIMASLGPAYLETLLSEMTALLTKGFQIHVLIFTIHSVLVSMKATFKSGDMDNCLKHILDICKLDIFGIAAEEKEVTKIVSKVSEARAHKSYDTLRIAAQFISEKCFIDILMPLKDVLATTSSYTMLVRVSEGLRHIVQGLNDNEFVALDSLLMFIFGVVSGNVSALKMKQTNEIVENKKRSRDPHPPPRPDGFIIPQAPRTRYGALTTKPSLSSNRNAHMLTEFAFSLLSMLLKRGKLVSEEFKPYVDPLVPYLQENINTQHVKLTTITLNCLQNVLKMDLPNVTKNVESISVSLFNLLHKYATAGVSQGEYLDMVIAAFKAVTVLVRDVKCNVINEVQLKALLLYVEQDMHDSTRQATAFPLLKAILARKLDSPEIDSVLQKVSQLSIISEIEHVRGQARQVFYFYMMNYPLGAKAEEYINFYLSQLSYELEPGRLSALQMLHRMISTFPEATLSKYGGLCFVALGAVFVNDERVTCKKMAAKCIKVLLIRLEAERDKLFEVSVMWMKDFKIDHRRLGVQICGVFVEVEKESFGRHFNVVLPLLHSLLSNTSTENKPGKFVKAESVQTGESEDVKEKKTRQLEHCIFQTLLLTKKICGFCPSFLTNEKWMQDLDNIAESCQQLLEHPHEWIRLESCAVLGYIFGSIDIQLLVETVSSSKYVEGKFLFYNTGNKLKSLILDLCAQLQPDNTGQKLIDQVAKNLAFLCRVLLAFPEDVELSANGVKLSVLWMIRRMRKVVNMEIVLAPSSFVLRDAVFKWIGALVVDLPKETLRSIMVHILPPMARELLNEEESNPDLLRLTRGIVKIIKKKLGIQEYADHLAKVQVLLATKRAIRKKDRKQEVISNPEMAAKRKIRKQQRKKIVKKRKIDEYKGRVAPKRKFQSKRNEEDDESVSSKKWFQ